MYMQGSAALVAARKSRARSYVKLQRKFSVTAIRKFTAAMLLPLIATANPAEAGLRKPNNTPLQQFGFATIGGVQTYSEYVAFYDATRWVLGPGAIVRTGLGWDPARHSMPNFEMWNKDTLEPALARGIRLLPGIRTLDLSLGKYRMPTDAQWTTGLRHIVRMYGPNGIYKKGGSYNFDGRIVKIAAHPGFAGLTDFELWNEPNTIGNLNGAMTPARIVHLLKIGSGAMRSEAAKLGFKINVIGPAIGGINLPYLQELWMADHNLFSYIDTLSVHSFTRYAPHECDAFGTKKNRCIKSFAEIRKFMDSHGGAHVHLGTTEGGLAGDRGNCTGPQVRSETEQRDHMEANLKWLRDRPQLDFDFWITPTPVDTNRKYAYSCTSNKNDIPYWESKLGTIRADKSLKPWGVRYRELYDLWSLK
jgi:hypothetical protein